MEKKKCYQRKRKVRLSVAVPEPIEKELREAAEEFGVSISAIITEVLKRHRKRGVRDCNGMVLAV